MCNVVDVFPTVSGVYANNSCIRHSLELLRAGWSDENLRSGYQSGEVDEVAECCNLSYGFNGTFTQNGKETNDIELESIVLLVAGVARDPSENHGG